MVKPATVTPHSIHQLATPAALVNRPVLEANMQQAQARADAAGVQLRPHIKTHKSTAFALEQRRLGAAGLTVATLRETEAMARAGFTDLLLAFPPIGTWRLQRLAELLDSVDVTLVIDSQACAQAVSDLARQVGRSVPCRWEVDCGARRCGTRPGAETVAAASEAFALSGVEFAGFFTFPGHVYAATSGEQIADVVREESEALKDTVDAAAQAGFPAAGSSGGTTPTVSRLEAPTDLTEVRPGNYVFHDATQIGLGVADEGDCALTVLATVVDTPTKSRVILDAGSKAIAKDVMSPTTHGFGFLRGTPELLVSRIYEEHGIIDVPDGVEHDLRIGDRVEVIPNHACAATNLHSFYVVRDEDEVVDLVELDARGWHGSGEAA